MPPTPCRIHCKRYQHRSNMRFTYAPHFAHCSGRLRSAYRSRSSCCCFGRCIRGNGPAERYGVPLPELIELLGNDKVDYSHLTERLYEKTGSNACDVPSLRQRAARSRQWLRTRPEENIVLLTHEAFTHPMTGNVDERGLQTGMLFVLLAADQTRC